MRWKSAACTIDFGLSLILVVDDEDQLRLLLVRMLETSGHECLQASSADEARTLLRRYPVDLILCDIYMPGRSGLDLLEEISADAPDIAMVMVTAVDDHSVATRALEIGAFGYVVKPFRMNEVLINVQNALIRRDLERQRQSYVAELEAKVLERTDSLRDAMLRAAGAESGKRASEDEMVERLALALEVRDEETGVHIRNVGRVSELIGNWAKLDGSLIEDLKLASMLHDVGKIGIPDSILLKPTALTEEEFEIVKKHAEIGHRMLSGSLSSTLELGAEISLTHHERWDGSGYPRGLSGEDIPIEGRITAVADVFDALTSKRVYRDAFSVPEALEIMSNGRGRQFDPALFDRFKSSLGEVLAVTRESVSPPR